MVLEYFAEPIVLSFFLILLIIISVTLLFFIIFYHFWFLRMPMLSKNKLGQLCDNNNCVLSPADGRVIEIIKFDKQAKQISKGRFGKILTITEDVADSGNIVCIAMNIFNIHYQISPINGIVKKINYVKGKFRNIFVDMDELRFIDNERNEILIESISDKVNSSNKENKSVKSSKFNIKIVQIAGLVAKRIHCFVKPNQNIACGETLGVIKLGSMVLLVLPDGFEINVKEGQKITLGDKVAVINPKFANHLEKVKVKHKKIKIKPKKIKINYNKFKVKIK